MENYGTENPLGTSQQKAAAPTFKERDLDKLPPFKYSKFISMYKNIPSHQSDSEIQSMLPHFQRLLREDEDCNQREND